MTPWNFVGHFRDKPTCLVALLLLRFYLITLSLFLSLKEGDEKLRNKTIKIANFNQRMNYEGRVNKVEDWHVVFLCAAFCHCRG